MARLVSIVVPNYNKGELVRHSMDCLLRQTYADWEAIIVDDCSTDCSWDIIKEYAAKDSRFVLLRNETNKGGCYSRNRGAMMAQGEYILFLDSDDWLADDCLEKRIEEFSRDENKTLDMIIFEMATVRAGNVTHMWKHGDRKNSLVSFLRHEIVWSIMMPIWRRAAFERFGGFDETFPRLQDVELHTRALVQGLSYRFSERKTPDCFYYVEESRMTTNHEKAVHNFLSAMEMYYEKMVRLIKESSFGANARQQFMAALDESPIVLIRSIETSYQAGKISEVARNGMKNEVLKKFMGGGMLSSLPSSMAMESTGSKELTTSLRGLSELSSSRILFFVPDASVTKNGVFASQVGGLAKYVESLGAKTFVWDADARPDVKCRFYQVSRMYRGFARKDPRLEAFQPTHIYVRTYQSAIAAKELAKKTGAKLVYSMRGADVAEAMMAKNLRGYIIGAFAAWSVRRALKAADHVNSVSKTMAGWIAKKFGKKASVLPCCVAGGIKTDGWPEESGVKTIVYSGGLSAWQKIDAIIALMKKIGDADETIRFRFLTKDVETLKRKCVAAGLDESKWGAKTCKPSEVADELSKADCGIIIRDDTLVNQVASPIKVGEYLAAGLGVIASPFIGDVGRDLADKDFACLVDENTPVEKIVEFVKSMNLEKRQQATAWVRDHLTYEGNRAAVEELMS